jgi:hypothetical protein
MRPPLVCQRQKLQGAQQQSKKSEGRATLIYKTISSIEDRPLFDAPISQTLADCVVCVVGAETTEAQIEKKILCATAHLHQSTFMLEAG